MNPESISDPKGPGSPYDPFPTPRIFPDKWDLSELVPGYQTEGDPIPSSPASPAGPDSTPLTDGFTDETAANAL